MRSFFLIFSASVGAESLAGVDRPAAAVARATPALPETNLGPRCITRSALMLPDPKPRPIEPRSASFGFLRRSPAAEQSSGKQRRRPARPNPPSRPIRNRRPRLEPQLFRSEPLDRDPSAQIQRYRFAMVVLHKNPSVFLESTRTPLMFKNIYGLAQFLAVNPLSFLEFEPAVQVCCFCELDPRTKF